MFLEKLRNLGQMILEAKLPPRMLLEWITDSKSAGSFFEAVIILEISLSDGFRAEPFPLTTIGVVREADSSSKAKSRSKPKRFFEPDTERVQAFPIFLPPSGNPVVPQGRYPVPVYLAYEKNLQSLAEEPLRFLQGRLERTIDTPRPFLPSEMEEISSKLKPLAQEVLQRIKNGESLNNRGLVALIIPKEGGSYFYSDKQVPFGNPQFVTIGPSRIFPGKFIVANLAILLDLSLKAKLGEGAEYGETASCSLCGKNDRCVSAYSKSFTWLAPTWHAPFPETWKQGGEIKNLAETVAALCPDCYKALTVGATVSQVISSRLPNWLVKEMFSTVDLPSEEIQLRQVENITGSMLITPILKEDDYGGIWEALSVYINKDLREGKRDYLLKTVLGYDSCLPEELNSESFLATLFYFTEANADIKLRAVFEDVLPSTLSRLHDALTEAINQNAFLRESLKLPWDQNLQERFSSLLCLLARAYGIGNIWSSMEKLLRTRELDLNTFYKNLAGRMNRLAKGALANRESINEGGENRKNLFNLKWEVFLLFLFKTFYFLFQKSVKKEGEKDLFNWQEFGKKLFCSSPQELNLNSPEEVGFASGAIIRAFSKIYYAATEKDFLQHRILAFGESLNPEKIWLKALGRLPEYADRVRISHSERLNRILELGAAVSCAFQNIRGEIQRKSDEFMANFWSGYMLSDKILEEAKRGGKA